MGLHMYIQEMCIQHLYLIWICICTGNVYTAFVLSIIPLPCTFAVRVTILIALVCLSSVCLFVDTKMCTLGEVAYIHDIYHIIFLYTNAIVTMYE